MSEWISVKERLPKIPAEKQAEGYVQMEVLVWNGERRQLLWYQPDTKEFYNQPGWFGTEIEGITHWAYLPEPPKDIIGQKENRPG